MHQPSPGQTKPAVETIHWPSLIAAVAAISAVGIAIGLGLPLLSIIMEKRGISSTMIGLNSAMAGLASMAAAPLTTKLAHKVGVVPAMLMAIVVASVAALGFYAIENFWLWFPLRVAFHGAITVMFILSEFWINATAPPGKRGLVLGIYGTVLSLGFAAGPLLFSILGSDGILPFAVGAGVILLAAIPIFIARKESPSSTRSRSGISCATFSWCRPQRRPSSSSARSNRAVSRCFRSSAPAPALRRHRLPCC